MAKINKTNAARILDQHKISYSLIPYEVDEADLSAVHIIATTDINPDTLFKTLVLKGDRNGFFVCVIPGSNEVDLKKAAKATGNKKCDLIPMKELLPLTGYIRGGCSPIGMKKLFPTLFHQSIMSINEVHVSAGQRGLQLHLSPQDLIHVCKGTVCDLVAETDNN